MMNSSSKTNNNLKKKTIVSSFSEVSKQPLFWLALVLTLVAISILVNLGFWQLSRADEKQHIENQLQLNQQHSRLSIDQVKFDIANEIIGLKVTAVLTPITGRYVLLDNQTYQGNVGYLALQLMQTPQGKNVLLERGFVKGTVSRDQLPLVDWLKETYQGDGQLYARSSNPLSHGLMLEETTPSRIQNLNLAELGEYWNEDIEPFVFQPLQANWRYLQPWQPIPLSSNKHMGYAVQWFAMALALAIVALVWLVKAIKTKESL